MKKLFLSVAAAILAFPVLADEGMWLLPLLKQQKFAEMQALGLRLSDQEVYSAEAPSLKDAVVRFGGGCTGEMISPDGLVLTNHHCGYSSIQRHSTLEHDYLTDGFWAMSRDKELPNPGLTVTFIDKIDDVTDYVRTELKKITDPNSMEFLSAKYLNGLAKAKVGEKFLQDNPGTEVEIKAFYGGNKYYMFTKKVYSDVRLVGAPPSSIGKFGADTDNWMWPRHTGDFSLFRVYADANGNPAPYSETNVPLRPKRWLKLSLKGVEENDYAMIMGFPGRTNKYYTSWEVAERRDIDNAVRINIRNLRQEAMLEEMLKDPQVRIQYASKYAGSTNAYKNAIGSNWAINKRNFEQVKNDEQDRLIAWSKKMCEPAYFSVIDSKFKGDVDKFVDYLFDKSIYGSEKNFNAFKEHPSVKTLREDPMILFAQSVKDEKKALDKALADFDAGYAIAHRAYVKGLLAMYGDLASFPDANSTLRLTYGQVKGYSPRDCDYYGHQTTLDGVMEKEDSTNWEFVVSARLKELYQAGDFGPYKMPNGKMPVAFCATTHTTGGNSGSPVLNGQGELIGINFDRNWEGVGGDIQYLPDYQRSIIVDIRYVLFVIDKYAGAGYLLNEMEFSR